MAVDIESFKSGIGNHGGFARPNRYSVKILNMGSGDQPDTESLEFLASAAVLPGRTIATSEVAQHRETYKHPYTYIDNDVSITFIIPNDFYPKSVMDTWMKKIINPYDYVLRYKKDYAGTIEISALDPKDGKETYGVRLNNCFPTSISDIEVGNDNENSIMTMTVTFAYDFWDSLDSQGGKIGGKVTGLGRIGGSLSLRIDTPIGSVTIN